MVRPMGKLTQSQGNATLDQCLTLFNKYDLSRSSNEILKIKNELNGTKDFQLLNSMFKVLQTTFVSEYNTNAHRTLCSTFYKKRVNITTKFNTTGLNDIQLDKRWANMIEHRIKARNVLFKLNKILMEGSQTDEEKSISLSYLYLASIDGIYGKNLKEVVIYDILSKGDQIDYHQIERMKISEIEKHFKKIKGSRCLFDGWDENIRNAIAHSSFWYDVTKKKIIYEERKKNKRKEKTKEDILKMIEKLSDVDQLVFFYNQIFRINKVIYDLK